MSRLLTAGVLDEMLTPAPLDPGDVVSGTPSVSWRALGSPEDAEVGIWEMTPGIATDTEVDEVFVVLGGAGEIAFDDGEIVPIGPGAVVRLRAGERTTWTVTETIRKVYLLE